MTRPPTRMAPVAERYIPPADCGELPWGRSLKRNATRDSGRPLLVSPLFGRPLFFARSIDGHRAIENHIDGRTLAQFDFPPACEQDGCESHGRSGAAADAGAFPTAVCHPADGRARRAGPGDADGVGAVRCSLLHLVLLAHHLLVRAFGIHRSQRGRHADHPAGGHGERLDADAETVGMVSVSMRMPSSATPLTRPLRLEWVTTPWT